MSVPKSPSARARDLTELIEWLRPAAERMTRVRLDFRARVTLLRGVYYGTKNSLDYEKRHSVLRNLGFNLYLRSLPPQDPRPILGADLVRALKNSAEVRHEGRLVDIGHVFVGLEARSRLLARNLTVIAQGGTGLELATWVGDLGGAAGLLAVGRLDSPSLRAKDLLFSPSTYDLSANLEGDLAGYLVARDTAAEHHPSAPDETACPTVPEALDRYLKGWPSDWSQRYRLFTLMIGGEIENGGISNRTALKNFVYKKTRAFSSFYLVHRLRLLGRLSPTAVRGAARHLRGAAWELSELFVGLLENGISGPAVGAPTLPDPDPDPNPTDAPKDSLFSLAGLVNLMAPTGTAPRS